MTPETPLDVLTLAQLRRRRSVKWRKFGADVLPLFVAEMDTPLAPPIRRALTDAVADGDTGYAMPGELPAAFAGFVDRRFGWKLPDTAALPLSDVMTGVRAALEQTTEPGGRVVVSTPAYPPFFAAVARTGRQLVDCPLDLTADGYRLDLDRLADAFASADAYLLCNPHNPTGRVFTADELAAIAELADRHHVAVISDEIHAPLTMPGHRHIPFATLDAESAARGFTAMAASKAWNLAGLKTALLVPGSDAEVDRLPDEMSVGASLLGIVAGHAAYTDGEPWLDSLLTGLDDRRRLLTDLLSRMLPDVRYVAPEGTYLAWLDFTAYGWDEDPATRLLDRGKVAFAAGPDFGPAGAGFVRFNLATSAEVVHEAVTRMARAVHS